MNADKRGLRTTRVLSAFAGSVAAIIIVCPTVVFAGVDDTGSKPLVVITGSDSKIESATYVRILSQEQLRELWAKHVGGRDIEEHPAPEVDFDRCTVVATFQGATVNQLGDRVDAIVESKNAVTLQINKISHQSSGESKNAAPYALIVLAKTDKTIVIDENVQTYLGQPPIWKEVARLSSAK